MKSLFTHFGVAFCGLATCVIAVVANTAVAHWLHFDLFSLSVWLLVPIGALLVGFAGASGFYFGSLFFQRCPTFLSMAAMIAIAGVAQFLIYWLRYALAVRESGLGFARVEPFSAWLDEVLTHGHYRVTRAMIDTGEAGVFGYVMVALQFVGFLVGGLGVWGYLRARPVCEPCGLHLGTLAKKNKHCTDAEAADTFYARLFTLPMDGPEFAQLIAKPAKIGKPKAGAVIIDTLPLGCPGCRKQSIKQAVQRFSSQGWQPAKGLERHAHVPGGVDLCAVCRA